MNTGAITKRYARALLLYTQENGSGDRVFAQVRRMLRDSSVPARLDPDLERFIALLVQRGRSIIYGASSAASWICTQSLPV